MLVESINRLIRTFLAICVLATSYWSATKKGKRYLTDPLILRSGV